MGTALKIRDDRCADELRRMARREGDGGAAARMYAIANALEGMSRNAIIDACCAAWNALVAEPARPKTLCDYPWIPKVAS